VPLVSIVLIFLNEERFIEEAVQSLRDQTLADWELILVDDGSTDRSTSIARELAAEDEKIRYVDHPGHQNQGMSASRNLGVAHATAPYIAFLDADDVWEPEKLAEQLEVLESTPDVAMVVGAVRHWYSWDPAATEEDFIAFPGGMADRCVDPPEAALKLFPFGKEPGAAVDLLVRRSVLEAVGGFEDQFRGLYEDQAFNIKVFLRYRIYISSRVWLRYRRHDASFLSRTTRTEFLRGRGDFLDWFREDDERLADSRVKAAVRRARRELSYKRLYSPISDSLPPEFRKLVKRALAACGTLMHKRRMCDRLAVGEGNVDGG
jgi:glycosyltransferase involved in cell wall biosynthesis